MLKRTATASLRGNPARILRSRGRREKLHKDISFCLKRVRMQRTVKMSKYLERAKELRAIVTPHYNCGQSVVVPFAEDAGLTEEQAMGICANFGGGLKRASACGAITGGLVVLGLFGIDNPAEYYQALRENHEGMLDCADLLKRNKELGREKKPHCDALVFECVSLVEKLLRENEKI